jgi:hypothetical protein
MGQERPRNRYGGLSSTSIVTEYDNFGPAYPELTAKRTLCLLNVEVYCKDLYNTGLF